MLILIGAAFVPAASAFGLVENGGFEQPAAGSADWIPLRWDVLSDGTAGLYEFGSSAGANVTEGSQGFAFGVNASGAGVLLYQMLDTTPGQHYRLTFDWGSVRGWGVAAYVSVTDYGQNILNLLHEPLFELARVPAGTTSSEPWITRHASFDFVACSVRVELRFFQPAADDPGLDAGGLALDNVRVEPLPRIDPTGPIILRQPQDLVVNRGSTATFTVVTSGCGPFDYAWQREDDQPIEGIAFGPMLTLADVRPEHSGGYRVMVQSWGEGAAVSSFARLTVQPESVPDDVSLSPIAQWPPHAFGSAAAIRVSGSYVYLNQERGLAVYDIRNPREIRQVGGLALEGTAEPGCRLEVSGQYAYAARDAGGLQILDLSNPKQVTLAGSYPGSATLDVKVAGNRAYVADAQSGLLILDVTNPANVKLLGATLIPIRQVRVAGALAYATSQDRLYVLDVSDPSQIRLLNDPHAPLFDGPPTDLTVAGSYAYVTVPWYKLAIIDLRVPSAPLTAATLTLNTMPELVRVLGSTAYVFGHSGLAFIDVSNPSGPTVLGNYDTGIAPQDLQIVQGTAYLAEPNGLRLLDLRNPFQPVTLGAFNTVFRPTDFSVSAEIACLADAQLTVLDVSNPAQPLVVGTHTGIDPSGRVWPCVALTVEGERAYVARHAYWDNGTLDVVRIGLDSPPELLGQRAFAAASWDSGPMSLQSLGSQVRLGFRAEGTPGSESLVVETIDASQPQDMKRLSRYVSELQTAVFDGSLAYGATSHSLEILDFQDIAYPRRRGRIDQLFRFGTAEPLKVKAFGSTVYLLDHDGVSLVDVSDLAQPVSVGHWPTLGTPRDVEVRDGLAYVAQVAWTPGGIDNYGLIEILDVRNPRSLSRVGLYDRLAPAHRAIRQGAHLFVTTTDGLTVLDVNDSNRPSITTHPASQTVNRGTDVTFSVAATGQVPLSYRWFRNDAPMANATQPSLVLRDVQSDQAGQYTVLVSNTVGQATSNPATLTVVAPPEPPIILAQPEDQEVPMGGMADFAVVAEGNPNPTYQWYRNSRPIDIATNSVLVLAGATTEQAGLYTVAVTNPNGTVTSAPATLTVNLPVDLPTLTRSPAPRVVGLGEPTILDAEAVGPPPLSYQWYHNGNPIPGATGPRLLLPSVQASDAGNYRVGVRNPGGQIFSDAVILAAVDPILLSNTRLDWLLHPNRLRLQIPTGEGYFQILETGGLDDFAGSTFAGGEYRGPVEYAWPVSTTEANAFYVAVLDPQPGEPGPQETDEPELVEPGAELIFNWETPTDELQPGVQLAMNGTILNRLAQPVNLEGTLELSFDDAKTGHALPGLTAQPATLPIRGAMVQGSTTIAGTIPSEAQPRLVCRISEDSPQSVAGGSVVSPHSDSTGSWLEIVTPAPQSDINEYRVTDDGPWGSPLPGQPIITGAFGEWPRGKAAEVRIHKGVDLRAQIPTKVFAVEKGIVIASSSQKGGGIGITIDHGNGYASRYAHVTALPNIKRGTPVTRGQHIGTTSLLGLSSPNQRHLHFEIRRVTEGDVAPARSRHVPLPGEAVNPLGNEFPFGFIPALNGSTENSIPAQLDRAMLVPRNPATEAYQPGVTAQPALPANATRRYLLVQVSDQSVNRTVVDQLIIKPEDSRASVINLRDASDSELTRIIENPAEPGYATVPLSHKANWSAYMSRYYRFWTEWDTSPYRNMHDGPKEVVVTTRSVAGLSQSYSLRYGAQLRTYKLLGTNPDNDWLRFEGEVVLYNGLKDPNKPACRQKSTIILEASDDVVFNNNAEGAWSHVSTSRIESKEHGAYEKSLKFRFEARPSSLRSCGTADAGSAWIKAHLAGLPDITHLVPVQNPQASFSLSPPFSEVEAGRAIALQLAVSGSPGVPISIEDGQWTYRELKGNHFTSPIAMTPGTVDSVNYWYGVPFNVREKEGELELLGRTQGNYELAFRDALGLTACARIKVKKTLVEIHAQIGSTGTIDDSVHFVPDGGAPRLVNDGLVTISGRVLDAQRNPVSVCGYLRINIVDPDNGLFGTWQVEPMDLPMSFGRVQGQVRTIWPYEMIFPPNSDAEFRFEVVPWQTGPIPPYPDLRLTTPFGSEHHYADWNQLERDIWSWEGLDTQADWPMEVPGIGAYALDIPEGEGLLFTAKAGLCVPFVHYVGMMRPDGLEYLADGMPLQFGEPLIILPNEMLTIHIRRKTTP